MIPVCTYGSCDSASSFSWPSAGPLGNYLYNHFIQEEEAQPHSLSRLAIKTGTFALILIGQFPLSRIALDIPNAPVMKWVHACCNFIGFGALNVWSFKKVTKFHASLPFYGHIAATIGGSSSQIPASYIAYNYNNRNIYYAVLVLLANTPSATYSLKLTLDPKQKKCMEKQAIHQQLSINERAWMREVKNSGNEMAVATLFQDMRQKNRGYCETLGHYCAKGVGGVLAAANVFFSGTLALNCAKQWTSIESFSYLVGCGVGLCSAKLYFTGMMGTAARMYDAVLNSFKGKTNPWLSYELMPKLTLALFCTGFILNFFSNVPASIACQDNYTGWTAQTMSILVPTGLNLMISNALSDLLNEIILAGVSQWGTEEQKIKVRLHNQLEDLQNVIANSSEEDFNTFKEALPAIRQFCSSQKPLPPSPAV